MTKIGYISAANFLMPFFMVCEDEPCHND